MEENSEKRRKGEGEMVRKKEESSRRKGEGEAGEEAPRNKASLTFPMSLLLQLLTCIQLRTHNLVSSSNLTLSEAPWIFSDPQAFQK